MILEHELTEDTVQAFMNAYPLMQSNGWQVDSLARLASDGPYQNVKGTDDSAPVVLENILGDFASTSASSTPTSAAPSSSYVSLILLYPSCWLTAQ